MFCPSGVGGDRRSKASPATRTSATGTSRAMNCLIAAAVATCRAARRPYWTMYASGTAQCWYPTSSSNVIARISQSFQLSVLRISFCGNSQDSKPDHSLHCPGIRWGDANDDLMAVMRIRSLSAVPVNGGALADATNMPTIHWASLLPSPVDGGPGLRQHEWVDSRVHWEDSTARTKQGATAVGRHMTPGTAALYGHTLKDAGSASALSSSITQRRRAHSRKGR